MNLEVILRAGLSTGTILLFAAIGEIIAERAGVMNLGVEGMMLIGAMAAFKVAYVTQNAGWVCCRYTGRWDFEPGTRPGRDPFPG